MGPVNDYVSSIVVAQLLFLQSESAKKPIHLYINSPGGSVTAGLAIYDTMQYVLPPICKFFCFMKLISATLVGERSGDRAGFVLCFDARDV